MDTLHTELEKKKLPRYTAELIKKKILAKARAPISRFAWLWRPAKKYGVDMTLTLCHPGEIIDATGCMLEAQ